MQEERRTNPLARRARTLLFVCAAAGLLADQVTKTIVVHTLREGESVPFIRNVWHWTYQRNPGAAFSLFTRVPALFTVIAFVISLAILWHARKVHDLLQGVALGLVLAGALGNLGDRIFRPPALFRGYVVDFIDWRVWPTFNIADACVVSGAILLFLVGVRNERAQKRAAAASSTAASAPESPPESTQS
ncbi:MAG: signal peptidase II [Actinomycetota bacterium]